MNGLVFNMVGGGGGGVKLVSIAITTPPAKTTYVSGETFNPAGMVVTATYSNGATLKATGYSFSPDTALTDGTTSVTIEYTEGGVTKTAEQAITVVHRLESISITTKPTKTTYEYGDSFQSAGMVVKATYSDGATANVTGYSCSPTLLSTVGTQTITVSYTENSVTKTATTSVTVNRKTISAVPSQSGTLTYNGGSQSPTWTGYSTTQLTIGGTTSGTNAGSYTKYLNDLNQYNTDRSFSYQNLLDEINQQTGLRGEALEKAQLAAQYGDYSYLRKLGIDTSAYEAALAAKGARSSGGGSGSGSAGGSKINGGGSYSGNVAMARDSYNGVQRTISTLLGQGNYDRAYDVAVGARGQMSKQQWSDVAKRIYEVSGIKIDDSVKYK